jgi:hypothetical protein
MPIDISHFTMAGFSIDTASADTLGRTTMEFASICNPAPIADRFLSCTIKDPSGAELRVGMEKAADGRAQIFTVNPAFAGEGHVEIKVGADISDPQHKPFEINMNAKFADNQTPIVFSLADPVEAPTFVPGAKLDVDITGFSFNAKIYADEAAYLAAQRVAQRNAKTSLSFAPNYFIPSGMFFEHVGGAMPDDSKVPTPYADLAGTIQSASLRDNAAGKGAFWAIAIKSFDDAVFDIVLDPREVLTPPKAGQIVEGRFWLSARLVKTQ